MRATLTFNGLINVCGHICDTLTLRTNYIPITKKNNQKLKHGGKELNNQRSKIG